MGVSIDRCIIDYHLLGFFVSRIPKGDILALEFLYTCIKLLIARLPIFPSRVIFIENENKYGKHNMSAFLRI